MSTPATDAGNKRDRICDAAIAVFAEKGFHLARVSDVAAQAGVADGTIYRYFRNKEDLLLTIFEEKMALFIGELEVELRGVDDPALVIERFARHHFRQLEQHPDLAQVFQVELRQSHQFLRHYRPERLWQYVGIVGDAVRRGVASGRFRGDVDPFVAQWAFFGALDQLSIQWVVARHREKFNLDLAARQVARLFIEGLGGPGHMEAS